MSAFPRICVVCKQTFRPTAADQRRCPIHQRQQVRRRRTEGKRTGSTRAWRRMRAAVLARDKGRCRYCGGWAGTVDHVIALSKGGDDLDPANLVAACEKCNNSKGAG